MKSPVTLLLCPVLACSLLLACSSPKKAPPARSAGPPRIQRAPVSLEQIRRAPAEVEVLNMKPVPLVPGEGKFAWIRVPTQFTQYQTLIFTNSGPVNGVADYKVTRGGYLVVACNYDYQGNASGNWQGERWTREQFYEHGWRELVAEDMGGVLVDGQNRQQAVFVKGVAAGERGRLRCNKYSPPFFIVCSNAAAMRPTAQQ